MLHQNLSQKLQIFDTWPGFSLFYTLQGFTYLCLSLTHLNLNGNLAHSSICMSSSIFFPLCPLSSAFPMHFRETVSRQSLSRTQSCFKNLLPSLVKWWSENNLLKSDLCFHHLDPGVQTQFVRLGCKCFYTLSQLSSHCPVNFSQNCFIILQTPWKSLTYFTNSFSLSIAEYNSRTPGVLN